jgi:hypothetical protein
VPHEALRNTEKLTASLLVPPLLIPSRFNHLHVHDSILTTSKRLLTHRSYMLVWWRNIDLIALCVWPSCCLLTVMKQRVMNDQREKGLAPVLTRARMYVSIRSVMLQSTFTLSASFCHTHGWLITGIRPQTGLQLFARHKHASDVAV